MRASTRVVVLAIVGVHRVVPDLLRIDALDVADEAAEVVADPGRVPGSVRAQLVRVEELVDRADDALHLVVQRGQLGVGVARVLERLAELALGPLARGDVRHRAMHEQAPSAVRSGRSRTHIQRSTPSRSRTRCS